MSEKTLQDGISVTQYKYFHCDRNHEKCNVIYQTDIVFFFALLQPTRDRDRHFSVFNFVTDFFRTAIILSDSTHKHHSQLQSSKYLAILFSLLLLLLLLV